MLNLVASCFATLVFDQWLSHWLTGFVSAHNSRLWIASEICRISALNIYEGTVK